MLGDVLALKDHIFRTYWDHDSRMMAWVRQHSPNGDDPNQKELVAHLDQIYAYMLWLAPILPEPHRDQWLADLKRLANVIIVRFYTPGRNLFWGAITTTSNRRLDTDHTDFGHSVKTMWLIYQVGKLTGSIELIQFALPRAAAILKAAYLPHEGAWARRLNSDGTIDTNKEWWILAELDQVAATLALVDPFYASYLTKTWPFWLEHMVDHQNKEIWHWLDGRTLQPKIQYPKQHSWKNAFHSFEHALIGYIVAQQYNNKPSVLCFAINGPISKENVRPYFFEGRVVSLHETGSPAAPVQQVMFTDVH